MCRVGVGAGGGGLELSDLSADIHVAIDIMGIA